MTKIQNWLITQRLNNNFYILKENGTMTNKGSISLIMVALLAALLITGTGVGYFSKPADGPLEEGIEAVIKNQYDLDIDFTPESEE